MEGPKGNTISHPTQEQIFWGNLSLTLPASHSIWGSWRWSL